MFTVISHLLQMLCFFAYHAITNLLRSLGVWPVVPRSRRLTHRASSSESTRL